MSANRLSYFDNLKGILIILVVVGHLVEPIANSSNLFSSSVVDFIYLFHMPLFIFVSGLFCKNVYRKGKFRSEVAAYYLVLCFVLYFCLQMEKVLIGGGPVKLNPFTLSGGSIPWYFMVLTAYIILIPFFSRIKASMAIAISILIAIVSGLYNAGDFLSVSRALVFLPFFLAGYYLNPAGIVSGLDVLSQKKLLWAVRIAAVCVLGIIFIVMSQAGNEALIFLKKLFTGRNSYATVLEASGADLSLWACCLARLLYYVVVAGASVLVMLLIPLKKISGLTRTGSHSLQVYFLHPFVYYGLNAVGYASWLYGALPHTLALAALIMSGIILTLVFGAPQAPQTVFDGIKKLVEKAVLSNRADVEIKEYV